MSECHPLAPLILTECTLLKSQTDIHTSIEKVLVCQYPFQAGFVYAFTNVLCGKGFHTFCSLYAYAWCNNSVHTSGVHIFSTLDGRIVFSSLTSPEPC